MGAASDPKRCSSWMMCADDVSALIDEFQLTDVIVLGYSMGGAIAQWLAKRHPEKIVGAIFCATTCHFGPEQKTFGVSDIVMPGICHWTYDHACGTSPSGTFPGCHGSQR